MTDTDRAVSDVLSFVLVFSLITASVGIVTVVGLGSLQDARNAERIENGERAFEVLADNHRDIVHGGAPSRATEIKLAETTVSLAGPQDANVSLESGPTVGTTETRPITFGAASEGNDLPRGVVYEYGAVLRVDRDGAVMRRAPPFQFGPNRTVIHYATLTSATGDSQRQTGSTTVLVRSVRGSTSLIDREQPSGAVTITIQTDPRRAEAWKRYFETQLEGMAATPGSACDSLDGSGTVSCSFETDDLRVAKTTIRVRID